MFLRKVMDEKRLGPLIFFNYLLTVICQQRRKYHATVKGPWGMFLETPDNFRGPVSIFETANN